MDARERKAEFSSKISKAIGALSAANVAFGASPDHCKAQLESAVAAVNGAFMIFDEDREEAEAAVSD